MTAATKAFSYPITKRGDQVDNYHGTPVADPFRWLEDPNSAETAAWVDAQNAVTQPFLAGLPYREQIKARLTQLWNFEKRSTPSKHAGRYFWYRNSGLQNQSVLYTSTNMHSKKPRVLLDPNTLSADGTVALSGTSISENGKLLAYSISASGSDWCEWRVRDIRTGKDLPDLVKWCKFSGASWTKDNRGFFYSRYAEPNDSTKLEDTNTDQKVYYHVIGTDQSEDVLVYERPDHPKWSLGSALTEDGRYHLIYASEGFDWNNIYFRDLKNNGPWQTLFDTEDAHYSVVDSDGSLFWIQTDLDAPRGRVMAVDVSKLTGGRPQMTEVIGQAPETMESARLLNNHFVVSYLKDAHTQVRIFDRKGKHRRDVEFPGLGTVSGFGGKRRSRKTFYTFTSFNSPGTAYQYDMRTGESTLFHQTEVAFNPDEYTTEQVFYTSKDGTRVPMFICYRNGLKRDGSNPTYLYGYGGFSVNETPSFSTSILVWMEMGGIFAMPNLRGGGEYGEDWHQAGTKLRKQNVFDDFIAAAEYLIANGYTSTLKLAIGGGSNGGLLVGACMTQRPDLFAAAVPAVGVMDMLRFHKFTVGAHWISDYGCSEVPEEFAALRAYSPVHNVTAGISYPATLVTTADHDDRVVPAHSYKFIAELQAAQAGDAPVLIRIETKAGHGAGKPTAKVIEEASDKWAFLLAALQATPNL